MGVLGRERRLEEAAAEARRERREERGDRTLLKKFIVDWVFVSRIRIRVGKD
jgi:hypothetical protein